MTDAKGRFVFPDLPAYDGYFIQASKPGYFEGTYGRAGSEQAGARIAVASGQWVPDIRVAMSRPGSISGVVLDDRNEPMVGAVVRVLQQIPVAGEMQLAAGQATTTDDRGAYRIGYLMPGTYYVQLPSMQNAASSTAAPIMPVFPTAPRADDGSPRIYPITFFPAAPTIAGASALTVVAGESRSGIDLHVTPVVGRRVAGRTGGPESASGLTLRLMLPGTEDLADGAAVATAVVGSDGRFTFSDVPAGAYVLDGRDSISEYQVSVRGGSVALPEPPGNPSAGQGSFGVSSSPAGATLFWRAPTSRTGVWVRQSVEVGAQDVTNIIVTPRKGNSISGRFRFEGGATSVAENLIAQPAHGSAWLGVRRWRGTGPDTFVIDGLMPGEYVLASAGFLLKSIECAGQDYTFRVFDMSVGRDVTDCVVTYTTESGTLSGRARDDHDQDMAETGIVVFPVEPEQWAAMGLMPRRIRSVQATNTGLFRFQGLPAGDYFLIAVPADQVSAWQQPGFLAAAAPAATRVHLGWSDAVTLDLKVKAIRWPR
jgi:hypothetical protein